VVGHPDAPAAVPVAVDDDDAQPRELPALLLQRTLQQGSSLAPRSSLKLQPSAGLAGQQRALQQQASGKTPSGPELIQALAADGAAVTATAAGIRQGEAAGAEEVTVHADATADLPQGEQRQLPPSSIRTRPSSSGGSNISSSKSSSSTSSRRGASPTSSPPGACSFVF